MHFCPLARTLASLLLAGALAGCTGRDIYLGAPFPAEAGAGGEMPVPTMTSMPTTEPPPLGTSRQPVVAVTFGDRLNVSASFVDAGWEPGDHEDNVTLTQDGLQMFFSSDHDEDVGDTSADVWVAKRLTTTTDSWDTPARVTKANTDGAETSPCISLDGKTLWVGQEVDLDDGDQYDIFRLTRSSQTSDDWSDPVEETVLNSTADDIPRPLGQNESMMPLGSRRKSEGDYLTYLAPRLPDGSFGAPELVTELDEDGHPTVDGFLTQDGRILFFNGEPEEDKGQLFYAWRETTDAKFSAPIALNLFPADEADDDTDERDPFFDEPRGLLYYSSNRADPDEGRDIYVVPLTITWPTPAAEN